MPVYKLTRNEIVYIIDFKNDGTIYMESSDLNKVELTVKDKFNVLSNDRSKVFYSLSSNFANSKDKLKHDTFINNLLNPKQGDKLEVVESLKYTLASAVPFILRTMESFKSTKSKDLTDNESQDFNDNVKKVLARLASSEELILKKPKNFLALSTTQRVLLFAGLALLAAALLAVTILTAGAAIGVFVPGAIGIGFLGAVASVTGIASAALASTAGFVGLILTAAASAFLFGATLKGITSAFPNRPAEPSPAGNLDMNKLGLQNLEIDDSKNKDNKELLDGLGTVYANFPLDAETPPSPSSTLVKEGYDAI